MNSSKQSTQRRMLNNARTATSPRFAKLAARSPQNKMQTSRKTLTKPSLPTQQTLKDTQISRSSNALRQLSEPVPQRITQNLQQKQIQFQNGDRYEGGMKNNKMYGKGTYYFNQVNLKYEGQFYENQFHGWGALKKNYGSQQAIYEGNFQYGQKYGQGKYEYGQGHYYNGNWAFDKKNGSGIYYYADGFYNGEWQENLKHGEGSLKMNDGTQYKGTFVNGQFVKGLVKYPNGDQYNGDLFEGKRDGQGSYFSFQTQQRYKGEWKNNKKHGRGTVYLQNGDQLQCSFLNGQIDETQSCTYKWNSGQDKGSIFNGWFKNGRPEKGHVIKSDGREFDTY